MTCKDCKDFGRGECAEACDDGFICEAFKPETDAPASTPTAAPTAAHDNVNHPAHYCAGGIECIDALDAATAGLTGIEAFCTGNAIKYLWRWKHKNGAEDIEKAIWYLNRLRKEVEKDAAD